MEAPQCGKLVVRVVTILGEIANTGIICHQLRRHEPFRRHDGSSPNEPQFHFTIVTLWGFGQRVEQREPPTDKGDGLSMGRTGRRAPTGFQPLRHRLFGFARAGAMMGQKFRLALGDLGE